MPAEGLAQRVVPATRVLLVLEALAMVAVVHGAPTIPPVLDGARLPAVALAPAFAILLLWSGVVRVALVARRRSALAAVLADLALTAPVTVFLVALANGVTDVLALVPLYALSTAAWLLAVLQPRVRVERGHPLLPLCFAAGVGIVPWGVVALAQIAGDAPAGVRVATLVALAAQLVVAVLLWRVLRRADRPRRLIALDVAVTVGLSVTAWTSVLLT